MSLNNRKVNFYLVVLGSLFISCSQLPKDFSSSKKPMTSDLRFSKPQKGETKIGLADLEKSRQNMARLNDTELRDIFGNEWKYNRIKNKPPQLGLALSGGGVRAATFSIGVMKALHERGILQNVDIISSVSGGSYALHWYYMQQYYRDELCKNNKSYDTKDLFNAEDTKLGIESSHLSSHRFQTHIEENSDLLTISRHDKPLSKGFKRAFNNIGGQALRFLSVILSIPINLVANGLFDWDANISPYHYYYQNGIERTYGLVPLPTKEKDKLKFKFYNEDMKLYTDKNVEFLDRKVFTAKNIKLSEMKNFLDRRRSCSQSSSSCQCNQTESRLPFFIVNATSGHGRLGSYYEVNKFIDKPPLEIKRATPNKIFEFTPLGFGSEIFGYKTFDDEIGKKVNEDIHFSKAVAISGAAVDFQYLKGTGWGVLAGETMRALNVNLGYHLDNYNMSKATQITNNLLPYPFYILQNSALATPNPTSKTPRKYQGSDSENIDITERFRLPSDYSTRIYLSDGGQSENLGVMSLIRRKVKHIIVVDAENDNNKCGDFACFEGLNRLEKSLAKDYGLKLEMHGLNKQTFDVRKSNVSVFKGRIFNDDDTFKTNLTYIKLSYNKEKLGSYPPSVIDWDRYDGNIEVKICMEQKKRQKDAKKLSIHCQEILEEKRKSRNFPQVTTADVFFQKPQVKAYRDLGHYLISNENFDSFTNDINCSLKLPEKENLTCK